MGNVATLKCPPGRCAQPCVAGSCGAFSGVTPCTTTFGAENVAPPSTDVTIFTSDPALQTMWTAPSCAIAISGANESLTFVSKPEPTGREPTPRQVAP